MTNKKIYLVIFLFLILLFCYFRLKPIYFQAIPYTYDQGRDFLKVEEIVRYKNPTFIGPTTGIIGIYHGVWWYYVLAIPYILTQGNPMAFIVFFFLLALLQYLLFTLFLKKYFGWLPAIFFATTVTASSYFINMSLFGISSILNLPCVLLFFYFLYKFLEKKKEIYLFLIFLSLGFILESGEMVLGIFIIPSFVISIIVLKQLRNFFPKIKNFTYALAGLIIPMIPRILFEIKNGFPELIVLLGFFAKPVIHNPRTFTQRIIERLDLFSHFYRVLFPYDNGWIAVLFALLIIAGLIVGYKKFSLITKDFLKLVFSTFIFLFILSLFYPDNFWPNYYEGFPYFYSLLLAVGVFGFQKKKFKQTILNSFPLFYLLLIIIFSIILFIKDLKITPKIYGMKNQIMTVGYIYNRVGKNDFCVRIYTPPVIPYTYNYFFSHYSQKYGYKSPSNEFINNQCYFIMEKEQEGYQFQQRIIRWRKQNRPPKAVLMKKKQISENTVVELWKLK